MCRIWPISLPLPFGDLQGALGSIFLALCHAPGQLLPARPGCLLGNEPQKWKKGKNETGGGEKMT